jgi:hypothetical protein
VAEVCIALAIMGLTVLATLDIFLRKPNDESKRK